MYFSVEAAPQGGREVLLLLRLRGLPERDGGGRGADGLPAAAGPEDDGRRTLGRGQRREGQRSAVVMGRFR